MLEIVTFWGRVTDVAELPPVLIERMSHYFATYKLVLGEESRLTVEGTYGREHAWRVVEAAIQDYEDAFGS